MKHVCATLLLALAASLLSQEAPLQSEPSQLSAQQRGGERVLSLNECRLQLRSGGIIMIGASQTGVLEYVEPGEVGKEVVAEAKVAKIRDRVMQEKLKAAKKRVESDIEVRYANASRAAAEERYRVALEKRSSYSGAELMNLKLEWKKTKLQIEKAEVDRAIQTLEQDEINAELENYTMTSPISGEVSRVIKKKGESVRQGEDIMEIIDTSTIEAIGGLPATDLAKVTKGTRVRIHLVAANADEDPPFKEMFEGKITYIAPLVSRVSQICDIHAEVVNKRDRNGNFMLKQGMNCRMEVLVGSAGARR